MSDKPEPFDELDAAIDRHHDVHGTDDDLAALAEEATAFVESDDADHEGLLSRVRHAIERFETDHLELTDTLNKVAYYLSGEGL